MNLRRPRARTASAALVATLVGLPVFLTGCGGGSAPAASANATGNACGSMQPGVTPTTVKLGLIYPDTGLPEVTTAFKSVRSAVDARIGQQNANGGVNGRKIDLVWADDANDANVFRQVTHNLVDTDDAFGLIAATVQMNSVNATWLQNAGVPVTGIATSIEWSRHSNIFHYGNLFNPGASKVFGDYVSEQGGTRALVVIDPTVAVSANLASQFQPSLVNSGVKVVGTVGYSAGDANIERIAAQLVSSGADTLIGAAPADAFVDILVRARALGAKVDVALNAAGYSGSMLVEQGSRMAGVSVISSFAAQGSAAMRAYETAVNTYSPELAEPTDSLAIGAYVSADEMIKGLQLAGACPTRAGFIQSLRKVTRYDAGGLIAPADLSRPAMPARCENFIKVDAAGQSSAPVAPPTKFNEAGFWCDGVLP